MAFRVALWGAFALAWLAGASPAFAQINVPPKELDGVDVSERLGGALPLDERFRTADGDEVALRDLIDGRRPSMLVFAYHSCPMLCSMVLDGVVTALRNTPWIVGREFDLLVVSIDPRDTPEAAARKRAQIAERYGRGVGTKGFQFLVGRGDAVADEAAVRRVADAVGFQYRFDARIDQYAHPAAAYLLTRDGNLARYLYGFQFDPQDIRLGLLEASEGRFISTTEKLLLYCYHYDPQGKRYALVAMRVMRLGGVASALGLGSLLAVLWRRERRRPLPSHAGVSKDRLQAPHLPPPASPPLPSSLRERGLLGAVSGPPTPRNPS
jgi:protein SCO1/2